MCILNKMRRKSWVFQRNEKKIEHQSPVRVRAQSSGPIHTSAVSRRLYKKLKE